MNSPVSPQPAGTRTINRGVNPFAPMVKLKNNALTTKGKNVYERILDRIKPAVKVKASFELPEELLEKFKSDLDLETAFFALTPGRQRAYCLFFSGAKQSQTRISRIEKYESQIKLGKGIND